MFERAWWVEKSAFFKEVNNCGCVISSVQETLARCFPGAHDFNGDFAQLSGAPDVSNLESNLTLPGDPFDGVFWGRKGRLVESWQRSASRQVARYSESRKTRRGADGFGNSFGMKYMYIHGLVLSACCQQTCTVNVSNTDIVVHVRLESILLLQVSLLTIWEVLQWRKFFAFRSIPHSCVVLFKSSCTGLACWTWLWINKAFGLVLFLWGCDMQNLTLLEAVQCWMS